MNQLVHWPPSWSTVWLLPALFVAFTVHELAHALVAFLLGDTSQVERKRLTLNPLRHVSWFGLVAFLLIGLGWAKPVAVDISRFRTKNLALALFLVSVAGAGANLLTGLLALGGMIATVVVVGLVSGAPWADVLQYLVSEPAQPDLHGLAVALSYYMVSVNLVLAAFNLLPLPPLDGFNALMSLFSLGSQAVRRLRSHRPRTGGRPAASDREAAASAAQVHFQIGLQYHRDGELDEAIVRYRQAIAQDNQSSLAYYNLGLAYWAKGRAPLAANAFRSAGRSADDAALRGQAELRLREMDAAPAGPVPPPLGPGPVPAPAPAGTVAVDPTLSRTVWRRLAWGGAAMVLLAFVAWGVVTVVTMAAMMG